MKNIKLYLGIVYSICLIVFGVLIDQHWFNPPLDIKYGDVVVQKTVHYRPIVHLFELPKHLIDFVQFYEDSVKNEHKVWQDKVYRKLDSLSISWLTNIDINYTTQESPTVWYDSVRVKDYARDTTIIKITPKIITEYKPLPFYANEWFYAWVGTVSLFLTLLFGVI